MGLNRLKWGEQTTVFESQAKGKQTTVFESQAKGKQTTVFESQVKGKKQADIYILKSWQNCGAAPLKYLKSKAITLAIRGTFSLKTS